MRNAVELIGIVFFLMIIMLGINSSGVLQRIQAHTDATNASIQSTKNYDEHLVEDLDNEYDFDGSLGQIVKALS